MELVGDRTVRRCVASCQSVFEILSGGRLSRPMTFVHLLVRGYRLVDQVAVEKMCSSLKLLAFQFAEVGCSWVEDFLHGRGGGPLTVSEKSLRKIRLLFSCVPVPLQMLLQQRFGVCSREGR